MSDRGEYLDEFASTFREWHYLASGFAAGLAVGLYLALRWSRRTVEAATRGPSGRRNR